MLATSRVGICSLLNGIASLEYMSLVEVLGFVPAFSHCWQAKSLFSSIETVLEICSFSSLWDIATFWFLDLTENSLNGVILL